MPSCMRAPPEAQTTTSGMRSASARSARRVSFSPTTEPMLPPRKAKSKTPSATRAPPGSSALLDARGASAAYGLGERPGEPFHFADQIAVGLAFFDDPRDRAADDHRIGEARHARRLLGRGDAEADADRQRSEPLDRADQRVEVLGQRRAHPGHAGHRDEVDEAAGARQ